MPAVTVVERDYPNLYKRFTALGPLMAKLGNGGKGMAWNTEHEVDFLQAAQRRRHRGRADQGPGADRDRHRRRRGDPDAGAGDQRRGRGQGLGVARRSFTGREHTHLARAEGGREDPLPRRGRAAAQDHLLADLVGARVREGLLQRRLHQRARADPLAHAHRPPAALSGPSVDARVRRGAVRLPAADRYSRRSSR